MSSYFSIVDYLGDLRGPERLSVPPGGSIGPADPFLCDIAETARSIPSKDAKLHFLRMEAAHLVTLRLPPPAGGSEAAIMQRLANWCDEIAALPDNSYSGVRPCTARW